MRGHAAAPDTAPPSRVVATAGHVDHGKSTLIEWLTGVHPDRLAEERRRGLTIDLGFASAIMACGVEVGYVDVPGHVRFLKNMLAGVGAVDACLFVVAATEGWKPQTEDHLRILDVVGTRHGVVALTHAAAVDPARLAQARAEVAERVAGTFLDGAPVVEVDVPAGLGTEGPDGLRAAIDAMVASLPPATDRDRPRLWVDRSFAVRGAGTVVTGTLAGGAVAVGDHLALVSGSGTGLPVRVRGLESYGRRVSRAEPGRRLAVNVAGADRHSVVRGAALVRPGQWWSATVCDATLRVVPSLGHAVSRRGAYLLHAGTSEQSVRLRVLGRASAGRSEGSEGSGRLGASIEPGGEGLVRLWLSGALPLVPGDRYVLRDAGRQAVVGGGEVLDVAPVLPVSKARPTRSAARVVAERGWVDATELERMTGERMAATIGRWVVDPGAMEETRRRVSERVSAAGRSGLDLSLLDERERAVAATLPGLRVSHGVAEGNAAATWTAGAGTGTGTGATGAGATTGTAGAAGAAADGMLAELEGHPYLLALRKTPFTPPPPNGVDRNDLRRLVRSGLVVESGGVWFAASAVEEAVDLLTDLLAREPDGVRVSEVRDATGASRRFVLPLLAHLDGTGFTRRRGDLRVAGPALERRREGRA